MNTLPDLRFSERRWSRFGLRTLLLAVLVVAILLQVVPFVWRRVDSYRQRQQYANMQAAKRWSDSRESYAIDRSRGVPDDYVILVRRGDVFACFIPRDQGKKGESLAFDWYVRRDGRAHFDKNEPTLESGSGFAGPYVPNSDGVFIKFAEFNIHWSGNDTGWGFIYYPYNVNDRSAPDIVRICATDQKSLEYIDGRDAKWIYKGYPGDIGIRGDQPAVGPEDSN